MLIKDDDEVVVLIIVLKGYYRDVMMIMMVTMAMISWFFDRLICLESCPTPAPPLPEIVIFLFQVDQN